VPPEIALSILAEVLAAVRGRAGGSLDIVNRPDAAGGGG
jgi:xanthine/CO dehydrogenase XdhC/CoxF family maturation factor